MWYSASLFFQSVHNDRPTDDDLWEQCVVIIQTHTESDAQAEAERIGKEKEHEYVSATGDRVRWVFRRVESVAELLDGEPKSGSEVYSRFLRASEARSLSTPFAEDDFPAARPPASP